MRVKSNSNFLPNFMLGVMMNNLKIDNDKCNMIITSDKTIDNGFESVVSSESFREIDPHDLVGIPADIIWASDVSIPVTIPVDASINYFRICLSEGLTRVELAVWILWGIGYCLLKDVKLACLFVNDNISVTDEFM